MAKERGLFRIVLQNFLASFRPRMAKKKLVGEDYNGTKYYEDPEAKPSRGRSFEPREVDHFEVEVPAEWEAWLRYRRREPPTEDEVNANYDVMMLKKQNAAELEKKYALEKGISLDTDQPKKGMESFPTYEEYKDYGHAYRTRRENENKPQ